MRGAPDKTLIVRRTVRGPIVNDLLPWTPTAEGGGAPPISLRWRGLEDGVESGLEAMLAINCARNADETLAALEQWPGPVLNFVFADRDGRIGYHVASHIPRREIALRGLRPANDPDHAWQGTLPFDRLPQLIDPPRGWVATANNPPWAEDPPDLPYLGLGGWADGYRFRRIRERLEGGPARLSPDEIAAIQGDVLHARAVDLLPALLALLRTVPGQQPRAAYRHLAAWTGSFDTEAIGASIFTAFWQRWLERIAAAHFPEQLAPLAAGQAGAVARRLLLGDDMGWFSDTDYREEARAAYVSAIEWLVEVAGPDPASWRWGNLHQVTFPHPLGEHSPDLAQRFDLGPFPTGGGQRHRACRRPLVRAAVPGGQRLDLPLLRRPLPVGVRRGHQYDRPIGAPRQSALPGSGAAVAPGPAAPALDGRRRGASQPGCRNPPGTGKTDGVSSPHPPALSPSPSDREGECGGG